MPTDHRERLAHIRRFDQLVAYLRDELGWPIDSDDFEELTFDYNPEKDLGIDAKNAAKIHEIKRLRPLVAGQPCPTTARAGSAASPSPTSRSPRTATTCRPSRCSDGTTSTRRSTSTRWPVS